MATAGKSNQKLAVNRKASHDYLVMDRMEAGIELRGTEVKSLRDRQVGLAGAFTKIENGQAILLNLNVPLYEHGSHFNHVPTRPRRLLLHKSEILRLQADIEQKGHTIIPLSLYLKRGRVKVELGVCRGKRQSDKRETLRRRTAEREAQRAIANHR